MIEALKLPFLLPGIAGLAGLAVMSVVLSITTGLISGAWSAFKAGHYDIHEMTRGA